MGGSDEMENRKEDKDSMAIYAVPSDKILILSQEDGEEILKKIKTTPKTQEEREKIRENARKLRKKPEKK